MTANTSNIAVSSSLSVFSNEIKFNVAASRSVSITALSTGFLTASIPYQIQNVGLISGDWFSDTGAGIQYVFGNGAISFSDGAGFVHDHDTLNGSEKKTGILSISLPVTQGQTGRLNFGTNQCLQVPEPDTFWLFAIGSVLIGLLHSRMTRRTPHALPE
jgi:hypothetical protein